MNKFCNSCWHYEMCEKEGKDDPAMVYCADQLSSDAVIPISWIRKYIENHTQLVVDPKYDGWYFTEEPMDYYVKLRPYQVEEMLRAWEKENGR